MFVNDQMSSNEMWQLIKCSKDPFYIEKMRNILAIQKKYELLKETYNNGISELKNSNTSKLWNLKNKHRYTNYNNPMAFNRLKEAAKCVSGLRIHKVLDIGFGPADIEKYLYANHRFEITGIDISRESVSNAIAKFPRYHFYNTDVSYFFNRINKTTYDCVIALEVLEHIQPSKIMEVYKNIFNSLNPKGFILVSVPLNEGLEFMIKVKGINPNAHTRVYTPEIIRSEIMMNGFKILKAKKYYAFNNNYVIKTLISRYLAFWKKPNNILILAQKI